MVDIVLGMGQTTKGTQVGTIDRGRRLTRGDPGVFIDIQDTFHMHQELFITVFGRYEKGEFFWKKIKG